MPTCRAAVLTAYHRPLTIMDLPLPQTVEDGCLLVKVSMAGVCGTDVHLWKGQLNLKLPVILGHETVGEIVAIGAGAEKDWSGNALHIGDRITWHSSRSCGLCYYCVQQQLPVRCVARKAYGISYPSSEPPHLGGGYAEYIYLLPGTAVFQLAPELSTERVIGAGCALVTAIHGLSRVGIGQGDRVIVQGAGPVGIAALAVALSSGAAAVCVIGSPAHRLAMVKRFGAELTIDLDHAPPEERQRLAREWSGGYGADVVIECAGSPIAVSEGWELCRDGGRYLVLGHYADAGTTPLNPHIITRKQLTIFGSWSSEPAHMSEGLAFLRTNESRFPFDEMVSRRFPLDGVNEALQAMASWEARKSVVIP